MGNRRLLFLAYIIFIKCNIFQFLVQLIAISFCGVCRIITQAFKVFFEAKKFRRSFSRKFSMVLFCLLCFSFLQIKFFKWNIILSIYFEEQFRQFFVDYLATTSGISKYERTLLKLYIATAVYLTPRHTLFSLGLSMKMAGGGQRKIFMADNVIIST